VLEASVREARLIRELDPRFNRKPGRRKQRASRRRGLSKAALEAARA
jgi:hypothetical protein